MQKNINWEYDPTKVHDDVHELLRKIQHLIASLILAFIIYVISMSQQPKESDTPAPEKHLEYFNEHASKLEKQFYLNDDDMLSVTEYNIWIQNKVRKERALPIWQR